MTRNALEKKVDLIEETIRKKVEISSGFGELDQKIRTLTKIFRYYDENNSGIITFKDFAAAMMKSNVVGVQREIENLFNRYDEDNTGLINYIDFCLSMFGKGSHVRLTTKQKDVLDKIANQMIRKSGIAGVQNLSTYLRKLQYVDHDGVNVIDGSVLANAAKKFINISSAELQLVFDVNEKVNLDQFLSQLKRGK